MTSAATPRRLVHVSPGLATSDGAGVRLTRFLGHQGLPDLDPFLLLDRFHSDRPDDYLAGFPDHPHRGFETVTVMLEGRMRHRDSRGNEGVIGPGGLQWMTTGRGLVHSEIPEQQDGLMSGFQLWVNLPAADKMIEPAWTDTSAEGVPVEAREGASIRVLAGTTTRGTTGPGRSAGRGTDVRLFDVALGPDATLEEPLPDGHNVMVAVHEGSITATEGERDRLVPAPSLAVFAANGPLRLTAGPDGARLLVAAGRPIREPIERHGPFVMNTRAELQDAVADFQAGRF